jgi:hypothetical protein
MEEEEEGYSFGRDKDWVENLYGLGSNPKPILNIDRRRVSFSDYQSIKKLIKEKWR